jgi:hypothetical protein
MRLLFSPPSLDDLIRLLRAWRFWLLAALIGALLGGAFHLILPPPYRARATVNVDFNLEQAWPQETDRQQFYYLERETRKLEEIAWSDEVMQRVASADGGLSIRALRDSRLTLGQPAEGGWHFYASDADPARAGLLAGVWARSFAEAAQADAGSQAGLSSFVTLDVTQSEDLLVKRSVPLSAYLLSGTLGAWCISVLAVLFFNLGQLRSPGGSNAELG